MNIKNFKLDARYCELEVNQSNKINKFNYGFVSAFGGWKVKQ